MKRVLTIPDMARKSLRCLACGAEFEWSDTPLAIDHADSHDSPLEDDIVIADVLDADEIGDGSTIRRR